MIVNCQGQGRGRNEASYLHHNPICLRTSPRSLGLAKVFEPQARSLDTKEAFATCERQHARNVRCGHNLLAEFLAYESGLVGNLHVEESV